MSNFIEGQTVYSLTKGEGVVIGIGLQSLPIIVDFGDNKLVYYTEDGRSGYYDLIPEIYHTQPEITIPKRKVKREVKRWFKKDFIKEDRIGYKTEQIDWELMADYVEATIQWEEEI